MTQRALELLQQDCKRLYLQNESLFRKWGQTSSSIYAWARAIITILEKEGLNQRYIQMVIAKDLENYPEYLRTNSKSVEIAKVHIDEYNERVKKGLIKTTTEERLTRKIWTQEEKEKLRILYMNGYASEDIARMLKTTRGSVDAMIRHLKEQI